MTSVRDIPIEKLEAALERIEARALKGGPRPPDNGGMSTERLDKLETFADAAKERLARIETKLDAVATKGEMHDLKAELVKWIVATAAGLGVAGITVMTFVLNNAIPKALPAAQQAPIVINVPQPVAPIAPGPANNSSQPK